MSLQSALQVIAELGPLVVDTEDNEVEVGAWTTDQHGRPMWLRFARIESPYCLDADRSVGNLFASSTDLYRSLRQLVDWAREHTSPCDPNSPHDLLIDASAALARAEGGANG
jgi:hypothetical protein